MKLYLLKNRTNLKDNGYSLSEEEEIYDTLLNDVFFHPRWFLDNLYKMTTFRVSWHDYRKKSPVLPRKHTKKRKVYKADTHYI